MNFWKALPIYWIFLTSILNNLALKAQDVPYVDYLNVEDGLSHSAVRCIFQDKNEFIWVGTSDGLCRYDGYGFKVFRNKETDENSLSDNWVSAIAEDKHRKLWIATHHGLSIYNTLSGNFRIARYKATDKDTAEKAELLIKDVETDKAGNAYAAMEYKGLIYYSKGEPDEGLLLPLVKDGKKILSYNIQAMAMDEQENLWLTIDGAGLCRLDNKSKRIITLDSSIPYTYSMLADRGHLWIATNKGLYRHNTKTLKAEKLYQQRAGGLLSHQITSLVKVSNNELWAGTDGSGINILHLDNETFSYITNKPGKVSLSSNAIAALYCDKESRRWVGTLRGGMNIIDPNKAKFKSVSREFGSTNTLSDNFVLSFLEQSPDKLWIGTDGGGLSIWNRTANQFTNYKHSPGDPGSICGNFITNIKRDRAGNIWLATYDGGISRYLPSSNKFVTYYGKNLPGNENNTTFWLLYEDRGGRLWAGSIQNGMYLFNKNHNQFERFDASLRNVLVFEQDSRGQHWGGDWSNLIRVDTKNKKYRYFPMKKPVRAIHEDTKGNFWVGTEAGLVLFDRNKGQIIKRYTTEDGLSNNHILNIQEDKKGNLWISTYNGLSCFNTAGRTFRNYTRADGLTSNEFNYNASLALSTGEIAFGGLKGVTIFDPGKISPIRKDPNLVLSGIRVNNAPLEALSPYVSRWGEDQIQELKVPYSQAIFTFDFTAIQFPSAERIYYRYKMKGWDKNWISAGTSRTATYTNLAPGNYTFIVNCSNRDGAWIKKQIAIEVTVLPPWYRTWLAYLIYVLALAGIIYLYFRYKIRQTQLEYEVKLAVANEKKQKAVQEKEREINEKRLEFFTNISHEFRSPLSLIINPLKDMMMNHQQVEEKDLNIVYRNARRLLSLVDQLLLFRKADAGTVPLHVSPLNVQQFCNEVVLCFKQQAKSKGIQLDFSNHAEETTLYADREKLEIILFNLISNALKFTPPAGKVAVDITEDKSTLIIAVSDTGCGISDKAGIQVFEKFYQHKESGSPVKAGFGIGLFLAKQFAEEHYGQLTYSSKVDEGTVFSLTLKKGKEHFPAEIIQMQETSESLFIEELADEKEVVAPAIQEEAFDVQGIFSDRKTIITVDDDHEIRNYIQSIFSPEYNVYQATNAEEGMALVKEKNPDLVICDVMMPGMTGIEWCSMLKQDPALSYIPVILLTASTSSENKLRGLDCGADDYIGKPFEKEILRARVANLINARNNLKSYFYNEITLQSNTVSISDEYKKFLQKCMDIVEKHLTDQNFSIKVLASEIGMSHSNLYRKVKSMSGYTVTNFIRLIRLRKAAEMLINTDFNINEVAYEAGFSNTKYFRTQFVKLFGMTPSEFSKRNKPLFQKGTKIKH
ncbi:two-component regulator propeller domain-containing protein [Desertivirga arenae]|uniref:two-component regulator propeller domain-containing protein n=1 Tax=Desertivirga arenae TaxID=2810309 RepID=UPI001A9716B5|nr:two-component regulator propeller domain-containing protein [Pedobacter sp. SYSU D00823]